MGGMTPVDPPDPATRPYLNEPPTLRDTPDLELTARAGVIMAEDATTVAGPYALGEVIGRGGMGEVLLAHDRRIGRDIALKRLQTGAPGEAEIAHFLREARIQARLEHPAIAPVYELGRDSVGRPYFTMKRLAGTTLADVVTDGRVTRQRLLRAFADVCRAIDFAHSRGVVHRDLKPANIMLGEFGEVYVLDWGIAHVLATAAPIATADSERIAVTPAPYQVVGTPGYMAPEQLENAEVGPAADVYSLGAILFEILTGEPVHPRGEDAIASTRAGQLIVSPALRRPERAIPPELDAVCAVALAPAPAARPSARQLAARVQDYLDGDRDLDRRRVLAAAHLEQAREAARDPQSQMLALRNAGRALALDPTGNDAAALVTNLMLAPPQNRPPELDARLRAVDAKFGRNSALGAAYGLLAFFAFIPLLIWSGVTSPVLGVVIYALDALLVAFIFRFARGGGGWPTFVVLIGLTVWAAICSRILGPFIVGPSVLGIMAMGFHAQPDLMRRPLLVISLLLAAFLGPIALEGAGVIASTWSVSGGSIISESSLIHLSGTPAIVILIMGNAVTIVISGLFSRELSVTRRDALRLLEIHAWRLQQLVPVRAPTL